MSTETQAPVYGYAGHILRIDLTNQTTELIPIEKYAKKYIGGRSIAYRIFWEEIGPDVKALDPENKLIYMTGPTTATAIPSSGRTLFVSLSPRTLPEMVSWSGLGGWFGAELKFAGYDGLIIEGKAEKPTYIFINDGEVQFLSAENLWGQYVHETQEMIEAIHGKDVKSFVIGPAGENLVRFASITTANDNAAAKVGFGAVMGSKNLKAVACRGTGKIVPYDIPKILELRKTVNTPPMRTNPIQSADAFEAGPNVNVKVPGGIKQCQVSCSYGCNQHCNRMLLDVKSGTSVKKKNRVEKCVGVFAMGFEENCGWMPNQTFQTEYNHDAPCKTLSGDMEPPDMTDPHAAELFAWRNADTVNFWKGDYDKGNVMMDLCNQYGLDKWEVTVGLFPWFAMGKKEGVFEGMDFGMDIDVESEEFVRHILKILTYREGEYGNILAEGMARAVRALGHEKFGKTIYHGRYSNIIKGKQLDIPILLETAWGDMFHWQGRGYQSAIDITGWVPSSLQLMLSSRDTQTVAHFHATWDYYMAVKDDPYHNRLVPQTVIECEDREIVKDSFTSCEWAAPNHYWETMECEMYEAATGNSMTLEEMTEMAVRARLLFRAILIRNSERTREQEVNAVYPGLTYPDSVGLTTKWEDWNDLVDLYYEERGWDKKTGWPGREVYEKYGLKDVADEMESFGKLPS